VRKRYKGTKVQRARDPEGINKNPAKFCRVFNVIDRIKALKLIP